MGRMNLGGMPREEGEDFIHLLVRKKTKRSHKIFTLSMHASQYDFLYFLYSHHNCQYANKMPFKNDSEGVIFKKCVLLNPKLLKTVKTQPANPNSPPCVHFLHFLA
jgi:hypothetical protein